MTVMTCGHLREMFGDDCSPCCDSCHDDIDEGLDYPRENEIGEVRFETCCWKSNWILENTERVKAALKAHAKEEK